MEMANASFTRDEVILALDVLYFSDEKHLTKNSEAIIELCKLLQELPIHPEIKKTSNFRNPVGVSGQLRNFESEKKGVVYDTWRIGTLFHEVDSEFATNKEALHEIAQAIKRNKEYFLKAVFAESPENEDFLEGTLLFHLHRNIERRDGKKETTDSRCAICQLDVNDIYKPCGNLLQQHLLVHPTRINANKHYGENDFITVCPNCHAALHRYRPWIEKSNVADLLQ